MVIIVLVFLSNFFVFILVSIRSTEPLDSKVEFDDMDDFIPFENEESFHSGHDLEDVSSDPFEVYDIMKKNEVG